jgi:hypothetical protein
MLFGNVKSWCEGRVGWLRLILWLGIAYLVWQYFQNSNYHTMIDSADFVIHEAGHVIFGIFGQTIGVAGGTIFQLLVPIYGIVNFVVIRDYFAMTLAQVWLGISLLDIAKYVGDARAMRIPLLPLLSPAPIHDWNYLLSKWGLLEYDLLIGSIIRSFGLFLMISGMLVGGIMIWWMINFHRCQVKG